jgi:LPXTG-site transpeptidase (sortase) family protein
MNSSVRALAVDASGNLYAGGSFTTAGGVAANRIAKWDGGTWSALGSGMNSYVYALAVDSNDKLYAGGWLTTAGGVIVNHIAKWDGSSWSALGSGSNYSVLALAVDANSNLYAGGVLTTAGGVAVNRIAKWDGGTWSALGSGMNNNVRALAVDASGNLYAGGDFTTAGGVAVNRIAKWDGSSWSALGSGTNGVVRALATGSLYAGGYFTTAGGETVNYIAEWTSDNTPPSVTTSSPANGAAIRFADTILITFNEDMKHDGSAGAVNNIENYLLVEANGDGFQTTSCAAAGLGGNDTNISVNSANYDNNGGVGPFEVTLGVNGGNPLLNGNYRLFICGTTSVEDLAGNKINHGEVDTTISFTVADKAQVKELPKTGFAPEVVTQLPAQGLSEMYQQFNYISLEIPSLGVEAPIVGIPISQDGWDLIWLGNQAGWLHGTAFPSWSGNSAITAHVYDANGQPGLFNDLSGLKWGDEVIVHTYGQAYVYEVRSVEKYVRPGDTSSVFKHEDYPWLTLITCFGYSEENDSYRWRIVVRAVQTRID